jgi:hypothetical protein
VWSLIVFVDACLSMLLYKTKSPATSMRVDQSLFCARLIYASMSAAGLIIFLLYMLFVISDMLCRVFGLF